MLFGTLLYCQASLRTLAIMRDKCVVQGENVKLEYIPPEALPYIDRINAVQDRLQNSPQYAALIADPQYVGGLLDMQIKEET